MTCNECVHGCVCEYTPSDIDGKEILDLCKKGKQSKIPDMENRCCDFKDKSRFVELPCKVGDTVYGVVQCGNSENPHIVTAVVEKFDIGWYGLVVDTYPSKEDNCPLAFGEIGKWVFLTREEAEKKLEEIEKKD